MVSIWRLARCVHYPDSGVFIVICWEMRSAIAFGKYMAEAVLKLSSDQMCIHSSIAFLEKELGLRHGGGSTSATREESVQAELDANEIGL
mmetsp:Transcript_46704/g.94269  ORF Transcript_46704/g.94269 Transcript_46704/m.94269 type:complete len:90 (+) Transcript_46704:29-298(+)